MSRFSVAIPNNTMLGLTTLQYAHVFENAGSRGIGGQNWNTDPEGSMALVVAKKSIAVQSEA